MPFEPRFAVDLDFELDGFDDFLFAGADDLDVVFFFDTEPPAEELLTVLDDAAFNLEPEAARDGFDAAPFEELDLVERDFADEARDDAGFFEPDFDELDLLLEDFFVTAILFPPFISNRLNSSAIEIPRAEVEFGYVEDNSRFDSVHFVFNSRFDVHLPNIARRHPTRSAIVPSADSPVANRRL